jgi:L-asparaginase/Glu-tRNA(Gln) amidotransferase subunit D
MAYTASGLSMMIENLSKTVILTGAQVPFAVCGPPDTILYFLPL